MSDNFRVIEGNPESKVILHVPHASRLIPDDIRQDILLNDAQLTKELDEMTDSLTDEIAINAASQCGIKPWLFINLLSRLVIDPERFPDDREIMNEVGMGAVYRKTSTGEDLRSKNFSQESALLDRYFNPYSKALEELVTSILTRHGEVTIIDVHSYRPHQHSNAVNHGQRRPEMCLGTDSFHTSIELEGAARDSFSHLGEVISNEPYAGTYVPLKYYGIDQRVQSLMMETRADSFLDADLLPHQGFTKVVSGLQSLIERIDRKPTVRSL